MRAWITAFWTADRGTVTTDWIVLSFVMIAVVVLVVGRAGDGSTDLAETTMGALSVAGVADQPLPP